MLDIKEIKNDPNRVKEAVKSRNMNLDSEIDELVTVYENRLSLLSKTEEKKAELNKNSKLIAQYKKEQKDATELMNAMSELSNEIKDNDKKIAELEEKERDLILMIPNIPHKSVVLGKDDSDNQEIRRYLEPTKFSFEPKAHWDIGENLGIIDPETAAKVTGARFHFYKGLGARLERSIINFYLDTHTKNGYTEILPPFLANKDSMTATGQLPKFKDDAFSLNSPEYYLIPTAEVPVTNMHRNDILQGSDLTLKYCAYSACFRAEAGSAGRDTRGLIRQHQFNKVELVKFSKPENSYDELEKLTNDAERVLQLLNLPYRVVLLCSGDIGFSSAKTYDIEVYMPSYGRYVEISSCSNFEDFQARRGNIKYKENVKDKASFVHTLNGSGVAIGRTVAAILENFQNEDGSVTIPEVLVPYMGVEKITK